MQNLWKLVFVRTWLHSIIFHVKLPLHKCISVNIVNFGTNFKHWLLNRFCEVFLYVMLMYPKKARLGTAMYNMMFNVISTRCLLGHVKSPARRKLHMLQQHRGWSADIDEQTDYDSIVSIL